MRRFTVMAFTTLVSIAATLVPASADVLIRVDKNEQRMTVRVNGEARYTWPVSTGTTGYVTPSGSFRVSRLERTYFSRKYDNAPMPNAIFFTANGHAIHGTTQGRNLGRAASHGCVRLSLRNASTLFEIARQEGIGNTRVVIQGGDAIASNSRRDRVRAVNGRRSYETGGFMSAGSQKGREPGGYYRQVRQPQSYYDPYVESYSYGYHLIPDYSYEVD